MRKLTKYEKETIVLFNEGEDTAHIQTYNAGLRKRLETFSKKHPDLCQLDKTYGQGGMSYTLDKLVSITMPLMKDIIGITFVLALSGTINLSFVLSQVMTGGGPNGASSVLLQYMYTQGFVNGNFGYAMAITVFTLAISVALSMLSRKLTDASEGGQ